MRSSNLVFFSIIGLAAARTGGVRCLVQRILAARRGVAKRFPEEADPLASKLEISMWKFLYGAVSTFYGLCTLLREPWAFNVPQYTYFYTDAPPGLQLYYLVSFAFYMNELVYLYTEPPKRDRREMMFHHVFTLLLLGLSYWQGLLRYGIAILALHDITDPLLEGAKVALRLEYKRVANAVFGLFAVAFFVLRLWIYPFYLLRPAVYGLLWIASPRPWTIGLAAGLIGLQVLHLFWAVLIVKMAVRVATTDDAQDARSVS